jgi:hypothetical protein
MKKKTTKILMNELLEDCKQCNKCLTLKEHITKCLKVRNLNK